MVTSGYHSRFHFPHRRNRVEFTLEVPLEGAVVLGDWVVTRSDVCEGEVVIDGQRIYFDVWVEPMSKQRDSLIPMMLAGLRVPDELVRELAGLVQPRRYAILRQRGATAYGGAILDAMAIDDVGFEAMLVHAARLHDHATALDGAAYSGVMTTINGRFRNRWHFPAPPAGQEEFVNEVIALLSSPRLSARQADNLQRAFRGT